MISTCLRPTDRRKDTSSYRDARTHLKKNRLRNGLTKNLSPLPNFSPSPSVPLFLLPRGLMHGRISICVHCIGIGSRFEQRIRDWSKPSPRRIMKRRGSSSVRPIDMDAESDQSLYDRSALKSRRDGKARVAAVRRGVQSGVGAEFRHSGVERRQIGAATSLGDKSLPVKIL